MKTSRSSPGGASLRRRIGRRPLTGLAYVLFRWRERGMTAAEEFVFNLPLLLNCIEAYGSTTDTRMLGFALVGVHSGLSGYIHGANLLPGYNVMNIIHDHGGACDTHSTRVIGVAKCFICCRPTFWDEVASHCNNGPSSYS